MAIIERKFRISDELAATARMYGIDIQAEMQRQMSEEMIRGMMLPKSYLDEKDIDGAVEEMNDTLKNNYDAVTKEYANRSIYRHVWVSTSGKVMLIEKMPTQYLFNTLKMIYNHLAEREGWPTYYFTHVYADVYKKWQDNRAEMLEILEDMITELKTRSDDDKYIKYLCEKVLGDIVFVMKNRGFLPDTDKAKFFIEMSSTPTNVALPAPPPPPPTSGPLRMRPLAEQIKEHVNMRVANKMHDFIEENSVIEEVKIKNNRTKKEKVKKIKEKEPKKEKPEDRPKSRANFLEIVPEGDVVL